MASNSQVDSSLDSSLLNELREEAMEFYEKNGVPQKMEEILNAMFYDKPKDVYGHLVGSFSPRTKSVVLLSISCCGLCKSTNEDH